MILVEPYLYVGGSFTATFGGDVTAWYIARYNLSTGLWSPLQYGGLNGKVNALALISNDLYVGGEFSQTKGGEWTNLGNIARYDTGDGVWSPLENYGLNDSVNALASRENNLYVGGSFSKTGDESIGLSRIARYHTMDDDWYGLDHGGLDGPVYSLAFFNEELYVGGYFSASADWVVTNLNNITVYNTDAGVWQALPRNGLNNSVFALKKFYDDMFMGGIFTTTYDWFITYMGRIVGFNTSDNSWYKLPNLGVNNIVYCLEKLGYDLYVGGFFDETGDGSLTNLGNIARLTVGSRIYLPVVKKN
jgi:hypothetical protein